MKQFVFGHELKSKQVRRYRVNDMGDVRHALTANAQEYLTHIGIRENEPRLRDEVMRLCGGAVLSATLFASTYFLKNQHLLLGVSLLLHAVLIVHVYGLRLFSGPTAACIFESTGQVVTVSKSSRPYLTRLQGQRLSLVLDGKEWSPTVTFRAELVPCGGAAKRKAEKGKPAKAEVSVEATHQYSKYFSRDGFIYPPALIADLDELLTRAVAAKDVKRK